METYAPTTPFGRRPATLDQMAAQLKVRRTIEDAGQPGSNAPQAVEKWRLFRLLAEIRPQLGVSDRALSVLNALLSFHPETALALPARDGDGAGAQSCGLVVFPSNRALALRAHGMSEATLRRHLAALVEAGLLARRDSPNGKRYARKAGEGGDERFADAFGFDLTPLVARAAEFETMAEAERRRRTARHLLKERVSLLRRDAGKLIALGLDEGLAGDWGGLRRRYMTLMTPLRRIHSDAELDALALALDALRREAANLLDSQIEAENPRGNDDRIDRHQSNSKTQHDLDLEPASEEAGGGERRSELDEAADGGEGGAGEGIETKGAGSEPLPLGLVLEACPDVADYAPGGRIRTWSGFLAAAAAVRPMIGISPDAWAEAQQALGRVEAHVAVAAILQRSVHSSEAAAGPDGGLLVNGSPAILSPGGYLRALTDEARADRFSTGPMLMALLGQRLKRRRGGEG
jgi:replication initiation protein RepC